MTPAAGDRSAGASGVILYDKPAGISSHDVVLRVRRGLPRGTKVGHAGTLDPFATGLLLVLVGRATRVQRFLMALPKRYEAVARFGATSSTGDPEGEIVETGPVPQGDLGLPVGTLRQRPPAYSAVKVEGRRAYALARAGQRRDDLPEREVEVYSFTELWRDGPRRAFAIECSAGTYVRSLIADLGDAYCEELRRTSIGLFEVRDADPERIVSLNDALAFLPEQRLGGEEAQAAARGRPVQASPAPGVGDKSGYFTPISQTPSLPATGLGDIDRSASQTPVRLVDDDGLIAIAERRGDQLKPIVGLRG